ncbi:MAG: hypothetical protein AAFR67_12405 [Chloroflexota bacterium]
MLKRTLLTMLVVIIIALSSFAVIAQDNDDAGETDPLSLTATQLIAEATGTAEAGQSQAQIMATQSANEQDVFELTATQLVVEGTVAAQNNFESGVSIIEVEDSDSAIEQTMVIFGLLIFVLVGLGGGYVLFASRTQDNKRKLG